MDLFERIAGILLPVQSSTFEKRSSFSERLSSSVAITAGRVVGKAFGGVAQVYAKPTVMFGNERPGDWSLEIGFKVLGF